MITEKNIGYWMTFAILVIVLSFAFPVLVYFMIPFFIGANIPIFLYFNRRAKKTKTLVRIAHGINVALSVMVVMVFEALFSLPLVGIVYLIKQL